MNTYDSVKTRAAAVEKRYGKTIKKSKGAVIKPKAKLKPKLGKKKIGLTYEVKF
jgi:hypothetical protein